MIAINYEERYIFMLLKAVISQTKVQTLRKRVDWEQILKISDYHDITTVVYYGMLGIEKHASKECLDEFYKKYRKQLLLKKTYISAEEALRWQLERHEIHALWLTGADMYAYYYKPDMGSIGALEIMVSKKDMPYVHRMMREMDYEQKENRMGDGIIYTRVPGICIIFYDQVPFANKVLKEYFSESIKKYPHMTRYRHIHFLGKEEEYVYRYGRLMEAYVRGELKIRRILNVWQYEKIFGKRVRKETADDILKKAKLAEFVKQVKILSKLWFGEMKNEECSIALELEEYVLSKGRENRRLDEEILPQERVRLDFYRRDREEEWSLRKKQWWFPPRKYMVTFFPKLEKYPFLLCFFWLVRVFRFFKYMCFYRLKEIMLKIETKWLDIKDKWKEKIGRKEEQTEEQIEVKSEENNLEEGRREDEEFEDREENTSQL